MKFGIISTYRRDHQQIDLEKICRFDDEIEYSFEHTFDSADIGRFLAG